MGACITFIALMHFSVNCEIELQITYHPFVFSVCFVLVVFFSAEGVAKILQTLNWQVSQFCFRNRLLI